MSHVQIKIIPVIILALASTVTSCGNSNKEKAESMLIMASLAAEDGDYLRATSILDSIDSIYPEEIETRRKVLHMRPKLTEKSSLYKLREVDSLLSALELEGIELQNGIVKVDNPVEPYFVASDMKGKSIVGSTGIEARMMPDGTLYMISSLSGQKLNHTSVTVTAGGESATTATIPHDGERNDRSLGYEVIHYMPVECDSVCNFVSNNVDVDMQLTFNGEGGKNWSIALNHAQASSLARLYAAAKNVRERHRLSIEKSRLEKILEQSRNHQARTYQD